MLVSRLAMLDGGFGVSRGLIVLALLVMMGRLMMMVSCGLMRRRSALVMLMRRVLGLGHE